MLGFLKFLLRRLVFMIFTLVTITILLYGIFMLTPPEARAMLYLPKGGNGNSAQVIRQIIEEHQLDAPFLVQYWHWAGRMLRGDWGWSPAMRSDVLEAMIRRTPVTAELTIYSVLVFFSAGLVCGTWAAWKRGRLFDRGFRLATFVSTSIPPFILGLILISIFYVGLNWFPIGRISRSNDLEIKSEDFRTYTGMLTVDGFINGRLDISADALRHLVLPVLTLSLAHWATLGRVTRTSMTEELSQDYVVAARGRGVSMRRAVWWHALRNGLLPALNSTAISAAMLITGVYVVEVIFALPGISEPITQSSKSSIFAFVLVPDIAVVMGFAVYSVIVVLIFMFVLDIVQAIVDPRLREGIL
jgi:ABC-type dipeptide/oligopeptide/nickel transport system permease component